MANTHPQSGYASRTTNNAAAALSSAQDLIQLVALRQKRDLPLPPDWDQLTPRQQMLFARATCTYWEGR